MAAILPFVPRPAAAETARPQGTAAAIIIFPGVRYEALSTNKGIRGVAPLRPSRPGPASR